MCSVPGLCGAVCSIPGLCGAVCSFPGFKVFLDVRDMCITFVEILILNVNVLLR